MVGTINEQVEVELPTAAVAGKQRRDWISFAIRQCQLKLQGTQYFGSLDLPLSLTASVRRYYVSCSYLLSNAFVYGDVLMLAI